MYVEKYEAYKIKIINMTEDVMFNVLVCNLNIGESFLKALRIEILIKALVKVLYTNTKEIFMNAKQEGVKYCQSCAMPMTDDGLYGTNRDGGKSEDYCKYCFSAGEFLAPVTMEAMMNICIPHVLSANPTMSKENAQKMLEEIFPNLKRWKN